MNKHAKNFEFLFVQNRARLSLARRGRRDSHYCLRLSFLLEWCLTSPGHGAVCGFAKITFSSIDKLYILNLFTRERLHDPRKRLHSEKVTVRCGFTAAFLIKLHFLKRGLVQLNSNLFRQWKIVT